MSGVGLGLKAAAFAARFAGVGGALKKVPRWAWIALAVVVALVVLTICHQHKAHAAIAAAKAAQKTADDAAWQAAFDKERAAAAKWKQAAELKGRAISDQQRKLNDETNARVAADAGDLLVRGPGKAAPAGCRPVDRPGLPAAAGGPQPPGLARDDARAALPGDDGSAERAVVPWRWLVGRARECDLDRAETLTWRNWWQLQAKATEAARASAPALGRNKP